MTSQQFRRGVVVVSILVAAGILFYSTQGNRQKTESSKRALTVAAAADLNSTMGDIVAAFNAEHSDFQIGVTFGSSGNFFAQLSNHAPFDVFLSADSDYPKRLIEQNLAAAESKFTYAVGRIVIWVPEKSTIELASLGEKSLLDSGVRKIAIANPRYAPYGRAAEAALHRLGVYEQVKDKLVLGDNVAQTAQFIQSGAADIGIISKSQALALGDAGRLWEIPPSAYPKIEQAGVILSWAKDEAAAEAFRAFMIGKEGQAILRRHGFSPPEG
jgi:molybdate transport system substrate-binding protein